MKAEGEDLRTQHSTKREDGNISRSRRTASCFGGWEYLVKGRPDQHGVWIHHIDMLTTTTEHQAQLKTAQTEHRQSHSLRDLLATQYGNVMRSSVGRMEIAITGPKSSSQTEKGSSRN